MANMRQCEWKLRLCVRNAREARRNSWQCPAKLRPKFLKLSREAMEDARYWAQKMLEGAQ